MWANKQVPIDWANTNNLEDKTYSLDQWLPNLVLEDCKQLGTLHHLEQDEYG